MNEPLTTFPRGPEDPTPSWLSATNPRDAARRGLRRRLLALLGAGGVAFVLTTWILVRFENPLGPAGLSSTPESVVRAHLEALNRGELHAAYALFSPRYRQNVSFEAYHELVVKHWRKFRTRELQFSKEEESGGRAILETRLLAEGGERYVARFTLVRAEGRWWIDDLRWGTERGSGKLLTV